MRISEYSVAMDSRYYYSEAHNEEERLKFWVNTPADSLTISEEGKNLALKAAKPEESEDKEKVIEIKIDEKEKQKILLLEKMLEAITGKKFKILIPKEIKLKKLLNDTEVSKNHSINNFSSSSGWGLLYSFQKYDYEKEILHFRSEGTVVTTDSRKITFTLTLNAKSEFIFSSNLELRLGDAAKDPLVINFNGVLPSFSEEKISFDIDLDGKEDLLPFLPFGSGFLALDVNGDGVINDGRELFGPKTGNGFSELKEFDSDSNNWIDENDPIFEKLRIWTLDESGNKVLFALGEKGVGAIYLGNIFTLFNLKDEKNNHLGKIRSTGIFVKENGAVGTVHHLDIVL